MRYNPKKHRLPICPAEGVLTIDKPLGWTSFDVVNFVRARFNVPKVGHCGTLDPAASGLLVLVLGKFTAVISEEVETVVGIHVEIPTGERFALAAA